MIGHASEMKWYDVEMYWSTFQTGAVQFWSVIISDVISSFLVEEKKKQKIPLKIQYCSKFTSSSHLWNGAAVKSRRCWKHIKNPSEFQLLKRRKHMHLGFDYRIAFFIWLFDDDDSWFILGTDFLIWIESIFRTNKMRLKFPPRKH